MPDVPPADHTPIVGLDGKTYKRPDTSRDAVQARIAALLKDEPDTLRLFREATTAPAHRPAKEQREETTSIRSTSLQPQHGTTKAYTLTRLHKVRPDLYDRVVASDVSAAHANGPRAGKSGASFFSVV